MGTKNKIHFIMNKIILSLTCLAIVMTSCSKGKETAIPTDPEPIDQKDEEYEFYKLEFQGNDASVEEFVENKPSLNYSNRTNTTQSIVIDPRPLYEMSMFEPENAKHYFIVDSTKKVSVPLQINDSQIALGVEKWNYSTKPSKLDTELNFKESIDVKPATHVTVNLSITYTKIRSPYTLLIKNIFTKELVSIKGEWVGIYPGSVKTSFDVSDL